MHDSLPAKDTGDVEDISNVSRKSSYNIGQVSKLPFRITQDDHQKIEHDNDKKLLVPFTAMAVQTIIDNHLVREYERIFLPMEHR